MIKKIDLSLDNFKKWVEDQSQVEPIGQSKKELVGTEVQSKVGINKLTNKIEIEEGIEKIVCNDFLENGGKIVAVNEKHFLIEVATGKFYLHRSYVSKA